MLIVALVNQAQTETTNCFRSCCFEFKKGENERWKERGRRDKMYHLISDTFSWGPNLPKH